MKTSKIFRYLLALVVISCSTINAMAEEALYKFNYNSQNVELQTIQAPIETSVSLRKNTFERVQSPSSHRNRFYLPKGKDEYIDLSYFKYEVTAITMFVMADYPSASISTVIRNFANDPGLSGSFKVGGILDSEAYTFGEHNFLDREIDPIAGLRFLYLNTSDNQHVYLRGSNDNESPTFSITYNMPEIRWSADMPTVFRKGQQISLDAFKYNIEHQGGFTASDVSFSVESSWVASISNGKLTANNDGVTNITVTLKNNGQVVSQHTIKIFVKDLDYSWDKGLLYMDYMTNNKNSDQASYTGKTKDGLRLEFGNGADDVAPYMWNKFNVNPEDQTVLEASIATTQKNNYWRVGVGLFSYTQKVPVYTSINVTQKLYARAENINGNNGNGNRDYHGAEIISFGTSPWVVNTSDKFSTNSAPQKTSTIQNGESVAVTLNDLHGVASSNFQKDDYDYSNTSDDKNVSLEPIEITRYYAIKSYVRHDNSKSDQEIGIFYARDREATYTYYAYVTFVGGEGCPYTMPEPTTYVSTGLYSGNNLPTPAEVDGYVFNGWKDVNGNKVESWFNSYDPNTGGGKGHITLYADWAQKETKVTFKYVDPKTKTVVDTKELTGYMYGSSNNSSLSGTIIETPANEDFIFAGWFDKKENGAMVYDADGKAVAGSSEVPSSYYWRKEGDNLVWNSMNDVDLFANWVQDMVSVDVKVIRDDNYENTTYNHRYVGVSVSGLTDIINLSGTNFSGYITVDGVNFLTSDNDQNNKDNIFSSSLDKAPIWKFELLSDEDISVVRKNEENYNKKHDTNNKLYTGEPLYYIYTEEENGSRLYLSPKTIVVQGVKDVSESALGVFTSKPDFPFIIYGSGYVCYYPLETKIFNHVLAMKDENTDWEFENTGRNPQYRPIRIITAGSSISSVSNLNAKKVIKAIKEKLTLPEYAYNVGKTNVQNTDADLCKGLLYVDMGGAAKVMETTAGELKDFKDKVSDNCLFFMPKTYNNTLGTNVVTNMGDKYVSADDLVITDKVPFSSPYTFSTGSHIASYNRVTSDKWGSMCLPFPVKRSGSDMKFYNLYGSDDIRLAFKSDDGTNDIPANKPIACNGSGNFTLTSNSNAVVPADNDSREYNEVVTAISCENIRELVEDGKQMTTENKPWNFKGVRFDSYVYGTEYTETLPNCPNCAKKSLVYYFSKDKFTYVNSKGRVKFTPFRAYLQAPEGSSAKTFSLLVFDEDGATDITEIIDGNAGVANGKIYDLLGRRVKTPLKGHIYIVDGKKKQY